MGQIITNSELWELSNEKIIMLTKHKTIKVKFRNGDTKMVNIKNILGASVPPNEFSGFITSDDRTLYSENIDCIELNDIIL